MLADSFFVVWYLHKHIKHMLFTFHIRITTIMTLQSEERQMAQRWFVAAKPMSFEKNVTNISCRYGQKLKVVLL